MILQSIFEGKIWEKKLINYPFPPGPLPINLEKMESSNDLDPGEGGCCNEGGGGEGLD